MFRRKPFHYYIFLIFSFYLSICFATVPIINTSKEDVNSISTEKSFRIINTSKEGVNSISTEKSGKILFNGTIITMNPSYPFANVVGIQGEKIIAVGNDLEEVKSKMDKDYELIDEFGNRFKYNWK